MCLPFFLQHIPSIAMVAWAFVNLYFATAFLWRYNSSCNSLWDPHTLLLNVGVDSFISGRRNLDIIIIFADFVILARFEIFTVGCLRILLKCDGPLLGNLFHTFIRKVTLSSSRSKLLKEKVASYAKVNCHWFPLLSRIYLFSCAALGLSSTMFCNLWRNVA